MDRDALYYHFANLGLVLVGLFAIQGALSPLAILLFVPGTTAGFIISWQMKDSKPQHVDTFIGMLSLAAVVAVFGRFYSTAITFDNLLKIFSAALVWLTLFQSFGLKTGKSYAMLQFISVCLLISSASLALEQEMFYISLLALYLFIFIFAMRLNLVCEKKRKGSAMIGDKEEIMSLWQQIKVGAVMFSLVLIVSSFVYPVVPRFQNLSLRWIPSSLLGIPEIIPLFKEGPLTIQDDNRMKKEQLIDDHLRKRETAGSYITDDQLKRKDEKEREREKKQESEEKEEERKKQEDKRKDEQRKKEQEKEEQKKEEQRKKEQGDKEGKKKEADGKEGEKGKEKRKQEDRGKQDKSEEGKKKKETVKRFRAKEFNKDVDIFKIESLTITSDKSEVSRGEQCKLKAELKMNDGTTIPATRLVDWKAAGTAKVSIDSDGNLTAKERGNVRVSASYMGSFSNDAQIKVSDAVKPQKEEKKNWLYYILLFLLALLLLAICAYLLWIFIRSRRLRRLAVKNPREFIRELYLALCRGFKLYGVPRLNYQAHREFFKSVRRLVSSSPEPMHSMTECVLEAGFSKHNISTEDSRRMLGFFHDVAGVISQRKERKEFWKKVLFRASLLDVLAIPRKIRI